MTEALATGVVAFILIFLGLRLVEYAYHQIRHTPDWSPHWGSWVFAVLSGLAVFVFSVGR